jgi:hypothetical protein
LTDVDARTAVGFVVKLDSQTGFERLDAVLEPPGDAHDTFYELVLDDVSEVEVDVDAKARSGCVDLCPALMAARSHVEVDFVAGKLVAGRTPPRGQFFSVGEGGLRQS